jgi:CheY-like chemotaxis protein
MTRKNNTSPILLLDDDSFVREMAAMLLQGAGYSTVLARTAKEATTLLAETKPVLAIVDYRLPGIDGASWIQDMRAANVKIPMVVLSGSVLDYKTVNVLRSLLDVRLVLKKPIDMNHFIEQLTPLLPPRALPIADVERSAQTNFEQQLSTHQAFAPAEQTLEIAASPPLSGMMAELRKKYVLVAQTDVCKLISLLSCFAESNSTESLEEAISLAHRLRGSAGCYGFMEIGELAGQIEDLLRAIESGELPVDRNQILNMCNAIELQCVNDGLIETGNNNLKVPQVLMFGDFSDQALADLRTAHGIHSIVSDSPEDVLRNLKTASIDLVCIESSVLPSDNVFSIALEARRSRIPMVFSAARCALQKAERVYLGDSWACVSNPSAVSLSSELELASTMREQWEALSAVASIPKSKVGYASLQKTEFVRLMREMGQFAETSLALIEIDSLDEIGFLEGAEIQNSIADAARNLLRARFRFEDIRCTWSQDKLLIAMPDLPLDLCQASISLFAEEFAYLAFRGKNGAEITTKINFAVIHDESATTVEELLERVYRKLHNSASDYSFRTRAA